MIECRRRADQGGRQERDQHAEHEAARGRIGKHADENFPQLAEIDRQDRKNCAELDQDHEGLSEIVVGEAEEALEHQQMAGGGDRQELGQALDDAENGRLDQVACHHAPQSRDAAESCRRLLWRECGRPATKFPVTQQFAAFYVNMRSHPGLIRDVQC